MHCQKFGEWFQIGLPEAHWGAAQSLVKPVSSFRIPSWYDLQTSSQPDNYTIKKTL